MGFRIGLASVGAVSCVYAPDGCSCRVGQGIGREKGCWAAPKQLLRMGGLEPVCSVSGLRGRYLHLRQWKGYPPTLAVAASHRLLPAPPSLAGVLLPHHSGRQAPLPGCQMGWQMQ